MDVLTTIPGGMASTLLIRLAGAAVEGALLFAAAALLLHGAGSRIPARVRHASWLLALSAGLLLPLVPRGERTLHLGILPALDEASPGWTAAAIKPDPVVVGSPVPSDEMARLSIRTGRWRRLEVAPGTNLSPVDVAPSLRPRALATEARTDPTRAGDAHATDARATDARATDARATDARSADARATDARSADARATDARAADARASATDGHLALTLLALWGLGATLSLVRLLRGTRAATRLARAGTIPTDPSWHVLLASLRAELGIRRPVSLVLAPVSTPLTWGEVRPWVLLPHAARGWDPERRRLVLLHELAHVKRHDWLAHVVGQVACAAHWFDPLAWLAARGLAAAREDATDDVVLAAGARPSVYARHLLAIARAVSGPVPDPAVALAMTTHHPLESRLMSILHPRPRSSRRAVATPLTLAVLALGLAAVEPWSLGSAVSEAADPRGGRHELPRVHASPPVPEVPPVPPVPAVPPLPPGHARGAYGIGGPVHVIAVADAGDLEVKAVLAGEVVFTEDGTWIDHMSEDGSLDLYVVVDGADLEVEILPDDDGTPTILYAERDGEELDPADPRLREWTERAIAEVADEMASVQVLDLGGHHLAGVSRGSVTGGLPRGHLLELREADARRLAARARAFGASSGALRGNLQTLAGRTKELQLAMERLSRDRADVDRERLPDEEIAILRDEIRALTDELTRLRTQLDAEIRDRERRDLEREADRRDRR